MQTSLTTHKFMYAELQAGPIKWIKLLAFHSIYIYTYICTHTVYICTYTVHNEHAYTFSRLQNKLLVDAALK